MWYYPICVSEILFFLLQWIQFSNNEGYFVDDPNSEMERFVETGLN